jgi:hypothetical protein
MENFDDILHDYYYFHGIYVITCCDDLSIAERVRAIFDYFGLVSVEAVSSEPQVTLEFLTKGQLLSILPNAIEIAEHYDIQAWKSEGCICLSDSNCIFQPNPSQGAGLISIHPSVKDNPNELRKEFVIYSLITLLRYWDLYAIHAACVSQNGIGCLFVADSDCGKSTMAFSLVRQGWDYLSDDSVLFKLNEDDVEVFPLRKELFLDPDSARYFPEIVAYWQTRRSETEVKQCLKVDAVYPERITAKCIPKILIFPKTVDEPESQIIPSGRAESLFLLIQQSVLTLHEPNIAPRYIEILKRLVNQTKSYRLLAGLDMKNDPSLISNFISLNLL